MLRRRPKPKALIAWSTGKDSAWSLHLARQAGELDVVGALTTTTEGYDRVSVHGVRNSILAAQIAAAGLRQYCVEIPQVCTNATYEERMGAFIVQAKEAGITHCIFGDLFLEDVRAYRCRMLDGTGIAPVFPAWGIPTDRLARQLIDGGVRTHIVCIDTTKLDESFCGRQYTHELVDSLPADVDPCAERGEFHTLVSDGPMFRYPVPIVATGSTRRDGQFMWTDFDLGQEEPPGLTGRAGRERPVAHHPPRRGAAAPRPGETTPGADGARAAGGVNEV